MIYLGYVEEVLEYDARGRIAQIRPICDAGNDQIIWSHIYGDSEIKSLFPNKGVVTWFSPFNYVQTGSAWLFSVSEQPSFDSSNSHHDQFRVMGEPSPAPEFINLGGNEIDIEVSCLEIGLFLPFTPSRTVYFLTDDNYCIGPLILKPDTNLNEWKLQDEQLTNSISVCEKFDIDSLVEIKVNGFLRSFAGPKFKQPKKTRELDWSPPAVLIKRLFKHLRERDRDKYDNLELTAKVIDYVLDSISADSSSNLKNELLKQRCDRGRRILKHSKEREVLLSNLEEELLAIPSIKDDLDLAKQKTEELLREEVKQNLEELYDELENKKQEFSELQARADDLSNSIEKQELQIRESLDHVDKAIEKKAKDISKKPYDFIAQELFSKSLNRLIFTGQNLSGGKSSQKNDIYSDKRKIDSLEYSVAFKEFKKRCRNFSVDGSVMHLIFAALSSELIPLLSGSYGVDVLNLFSDIVTGGRKCWAVINPTVLQVEDLLKLTDWSNSAAHEISSVGSFLSHMATSDCQSLLVLDGINQAPLESYLYPFIQKNFRLNGNALMSAMSLGQNVRLCMIDRTEKVSRLPNWLLKQCCFIPVNDFRLATKSLNHLESKPVDSSCSELSSWDLAVSNEISESVHQQFMEEFSTDFVQRNISRPKLLSTLNFIQSLLFCGLEYEKARNYAAKYCLLPELAALANPKTLQDELGLERESVSSILEHNGSLV